MYLIIQIPCYNEEENLQQTLHDLPTELKGITKIEKLVINDGSNDNTVEAAKQSGVEHIISFRKNRGLAAAFEAGIDYALKQGADIIVNTDADNQYVGADIAKLVAPIVNNQADIVVGDRQTDTIPHFSQTKKQLQKMGSSMVRWLSATEVSDAVSGFRAYSRESALRINVLTEFSYTIENLIQLGNEKLKIVSVPVQTNPVNRKSRLFRSIPHFLSHQLATVLRVYATYKALRVFTILGIITLLPALFGFIRFLYFFLVDGGKGHIQSLVVSAALFNVGFLLLMFGIIAELISNNRKLLEKVLYKLRNDK